MTSIEASCAPVSAATRFSPSVMARDGSSGVDASLKICNSAACFKDKVGKCTAGVDADAHFPLRTVLLLCSLTQLKDLPGPKHSCCQIVLVGALTARHVATR